MAGAGDGGEPGGPMDPAERAALLAAIAADPEAEAPRLVYADWLALRGDPLGELIHAQLAVAAREPGDPALAELRAWERRILREHEAQLAGPLHHPRIRWRYALGVPAGFGHAGNFQAPPPSRTDRDNAIWLRFRPGGEVTVAWAEEHSADREIGWRHGGHGRYTLAVRGAAAAMTFSAEFGEGSFVDYEVTLEGGAITARIHSRINGWRHETRFELVHASDPGADTRDDLTDPAPSGT